MVDTVELKLNGKDHTLKGDATVLALVVSMGLDPGVGGVAVAVNGRVVSRSQWGAQPLRSGDEVELIRATAGG